MKLNQYSWDPEKDLLGSGSQGKVYKAYDAKKNEEVAVKIFNVAYEENDKEKQTPGYTNLKHKYIIGFRELLTMYQRKSIGSDTYPVLVLDYANSGNIKNYLSQNNQFFLKTELIMQLMDGVKYLHENNYAHGDIKPHNILVNTVLLTGSTSVEVKIADFENAVNLKFVNSTFPITGSYHYMSPERYLKNVNSTFSHKASDIWSMTAVIFELLTNKLPFGQNVFQYEEIKKNVLYDAPDLTLLPSGMKELISAGLDKDPTKRPSIKEFIHKFDFADDKTITATEETASLNIVPDHWDDSSKKRFHIIEKALHRTSIKKDFLVELKKSNEKQYELHDLQWHIYTNKIHSDEGEFYILSVDSHHYKVQHSSNSSGPGNISNLLSHYSFIPFTYWGDDLEGVTTLERSLNFIFEKFPPNSFYLT